MGSSADPETLPIPGSGAAVPGLGAPALERLSIYRDTCRSTLLNALRLSFPAVEQLVGAEFFEGAAQYFIDEAPHGIPDGAWLHEYGKEFAAFLTSFPAAAELSYLGDVARLEWAVNRALHAPDAVRLDAAQVASRIGDHADARLVPHPSIGLLSLRSPADTIWQAVLNDEDAALGAIDPTSGPIWLLVERGEAGLHVERLDESAWRLTERLCAGLPLHAALAESCVEPAPGGGSGSSADGAPMLLATHLSAGRFIDVLLPDGGESPLPRTYEAAGASAGAAHPSGGSVP
jgi:hypothetical protein